MVIVLSMIVPAARASELNFMERLAGPEGQPAQPAAETADAPGGESAEAGPDLEAIQAQVLALQAELEAIEASGDASASLDPEEALPPPVEVAVVETTASVDAAAGSSPVAVGVGLYSAYAFRGLNVFQSSAQNDPNGMLAPSLSLSLSDSFSVGYWGAYQTTGDNRQAMVASGLGHEQDLWLSWGSQLSDAWSLSATGTWYFYPFAEADSAGAEIPSWVEPSAGLSWSGPVNVSLSAGWMMGVQQALQSASYFGLRPGLSKSISLRSDATLGFGLSGGYKRFVTGEAIQSNSLDLQADWWLSMLVGDRFTTTPGLHASWTNLSGISAEDEYFVWWGLDTALNL